MKERSRVRDPSVFRRNRFLLGRGWCGKSGGPGCSGFCEFGKFRVPTPPQRRSQEVWVSHCDALSCVWKIRMGDVRFAAVAPVVIVGRCGTRATFLIGADIPNLLRKGALETLWRDIGFPHNCLRIRKIGVCVLLNLNIARRHVLSVASFDVKGAPSLGRAATQAVLRFSRVNEILHPKVALLQDREDGP